MKGLSNEERQAFGALLEDMSQETVMARIPQFFDATIHAAARSSRETDTVHTLVFNIERGGNLAETLDFLEHCPAVRPFDLLLANELDDGAVRSGGRDVAQELAQRLQMHSVFGLEFIELAEPRDEKGFHGNAIFSRYPITWAKVLRLPEEYNWYHDRQKRIGSRNAILAKLDVGGQAVGVVCTHLENRTSGEGRARQMHYVLAAVREAFPGLPVILGGDLNTNTFDGRDKAAILALAADSAERQRRICDTARFEPLLPALEAAGFSWREANVLSEGTRRKPLPSGETLCIHLDWLAARGLTPAAARTVSTLQADCGFAPAGSALARFEGQELSDHNAIWTAFRLPRPTEKEDAHAEHRAV